MRWIKLAAGWRQRWAERLIVVGAALLVVAAVSSTRLRSHYFGRDLFDIGHGSMTYWWARSGYYPSWSLSGWRIVYEEPWSRGGFDTDWHFGVSSEWIVVTIPFWEFGVGLLLAGWLLQVRWTSGWRNWIRDGRIARHLCPECGYSREGLKTDTCPECGSRQAE